MAGATDLLAATRVDVDVVAAKPVEGLGVFVEGVAFVGGEDDLASELTGHALILGDVGGALGGAWPVRDLPLARRGSDCEASACSG